MFNIKQWILGYKDELEEQRIIEFIKGRNRIRWDGRKYIQVSKYPNMLFTPKKRWH